MSSDVVLLATEVPATNVVYNALAARFGAPALILERPISRLYLARRRAPRIGWGTVAGQLLFGGTVAPLLARAGADRMGVIEAQYGLDASAIQGTAERVDSTNDEATRAALRALDPKVVIVNGTRIISAATLDCVPAPFINVHTGITPRYRGVHGAYWALREGNPGLVGATVHYVDQGVDTGEVIGQVTFEADPEDTYATLPMRQLGEALPVLLDAVEGVLAGAPPPTIAPLASGSRLYYHPTIWGYLTGRLRDGVR